MKIDLQAFFDEQKAKLESTDPRKLKYIELGVKGLIEGLKALAAQGFIFEVVPIQGSPLYPTVQGHKTPEELSEEARMKASVDGVKRAEQMQPNRPPLAGSGILGLERLPNETDAQWQARKDAEAQRLAGLHSPADETAAQKAAREQKAKDEASARAKASAVSKAADDAKLAAAKKIADEAAARAAVQK